MKGILIALGTGIVLATLPFACAKYDVLYNRTARTEVGKSIMDSDREIFKNSKPYIENSIQTLHSYKMQYDLASDEDKQIIANNIKSEFANFDSNLIENNNLKHFLESIRGGY